MQSRPRHRSPLRVLIPAILCAVALATLVVFPEWYAQLGLRRLDAYVCPQNETLSMRLQHGVNFVRRQVGLGVARRQPQSPAVSAPAAPELGVPGLVLTTVAAGLMAPTTLTFLDDNTFLILEKNTGRVKHVRNGEAKTVLDLAVNSNNERGALGIIRHPQVGRNGFVYLYWTWRGKGTGPRRLTGADTVEPLDVPRRGNRVDRFRWDGKKLRFDRNIITLPSVAATYYGGYRGVHNGGILAFDAHGKLYAVMGDSHLRGRLQNIPDGVPPNDDNLAGVILRFNDDGTAPEDNPFFSLGASMGGAAGRNLQKVFAYGIRNSFGMAFDPRSGTLWISENGRGLFDEIDRVPPGFNSGWMQIMGPVRCYRTYQRIEREAASPLRPRVALAPTAQEALARLYNLPGSHFLDPLFSWRDPVVPTAVTFASLVDKQFDLLVGDLYGHVYRFELSPDRNRLLLRDRHLRDGIANNRGGDRAVESESLIIGRNFGIITDLKVAPDGSLYLVSLSQGTVYRISRR